MPQANNKSNQWYSHQIIQNFQTSQKGWSRYLPNEDFTEQGSRWFARHPIVTQMPWHAVPLTSYHSNLTSENRNHLWKRWLKLQVTSASSFPSFIVNLISLSSSWVPWRNTFESTVITLDLQKNIPDALKLVDVLTIWKWEHWMIRSMDAYREGKGIKEAQIQVKKFGTCKQMSHQWVGERVARAFD